MENQFITRKLALAFCFFDLSKDGYVRQDDFELFGKTIAEDLGHKEGSDAYNAFISAYVQTWKSFFLPADINGDGEVTMSEYIKATFKFLSLPNAKDIAYAQNTSFFDALDSDKSGSISSSEYASFLKPNGFSAEEAEAVFKKLDRDGSGVISRDEFAAAHWEYWSSEDNTAIGNWAYGRF